MIYTQGPIFGVGVSGLILSQLFLLTRQKSMTPSIIRGRLVRESYRGRRRRSATFVPFAISARVRRWVGDAPYAGPLGVLAVGKFQERKRLDTVIHGFSEFLEASRGDAHLTVVGNVSDFVVRDQVASLVSRLGLQGCVSLLSDVNRRQMNDLYARHQVFILNSHREPASVSQLEAMSFGLYPIVGSDNGTAHYVEPHGQILDSGSKEISRLLCQIDEDRILLHDLRVASFRAAESRHDPALVASTLLRLCMR